MKRVQLLSLAVLGVVGAGAVSTDAWGQALPPGQEAEGAVAKRPPFLGLSLDLNVWNQMGLWGGEGSYYLRNDFGFLPIPSWALGRRFIGKGPFRTLTLQARFFFNAPVAGFDDTNYTGDAPPWSEQQPCATGRSEWIDQRDIPRCPWGRGPRRADYSDLTFILANPRIYTIPKIDVRIDPSVILTLPVSAQSRLRTLVFQAVAQLGAARSFWKNRIDMAYTFGYGQPFFRYATAAIYYDNRGGTAPYDTDDLNRGLSNFYTQFDARGQLVPSAAAMLCNPGEPCRNSTLFLQHTIRGTVNIIEPLSLTVIYRITNTFFRNPADCAEVVAFDYAPPQFTCGAEGPIPQPRHYWTDNQLLWALLNYQALPWLGINLSFITAAPFWKYDTSKPGDTLPGADGPIPQTRSYRQGIVSTVGNDFTSVSLGVDISVDALTSKLLRK